MPTAPKTTRPARRIPAARLERIRAAAAARKQAREDAEYLRLNPTEEFTAQPRQTLLPGGLHWSRGGQVPAVGETVTVHRAGHDEPARVTGYGHAAGFLALVVEPARPAKRRATRRSERENFVFGSQLAEAA